MTLRNVTKSFNLEDQRQEINVIAADLATFYDNDTDSVSITGELATPGFVVSDQGNVTGVGSIKLNQSGLANAGTSPNVIIDPTGNFTSTGEIRSGGNPHEGTADGSHLNTGSGVSASYSNAASFLWRGYTTGNSTPTSSISVAGDAEFAGSGTFATDVTVSSGHFHATGSSTSTKTFISSYAGAENATIKADGSAVFGGGTTNVQIGSTGDIWSENALYVGDSSSPTISLSANGTASFASGDIYLNETGQITAGSDTNTGEGVNIYAGGSIYIQQSGGTSTHKLLRLNDGNNSEVSYLSGDGGATFTGDLSVSGNYSQDLDLPVDKEINIGGIGTISIGGTNTTDFLIEPDGAVRLYYGVDDKFGTSPSGIYVDNHITIVQGTSSYSFNYQNVQDWNTAHGWGDHSLVGYLTSETDTLQTITDRNGGSSSTTGDISANNLIVNSLQVNGNATTLTFVNTPVVSLQVDNHEIVLNSLGEGRFTGDVTANNNLISNVNSTVGIEVGASITIFDNAQGLTLGTATVDSITPASNEITTSINFGPNVGPVGPGELTISANGTGYSQDTDVAVTGGTGTNATFDILAVGGSGEITSIDVAVGGNGGTGYTIGDVLTLVQIGGNNDGTITVTGISPDLSVTGVVFYTPIQPTLNAHIVAERSAENNTAIMWNEFDDKWQFTNDGNTYHDLSGTDGVLTSIQAVGGIEIKSTNGSLTGVFDSTSPSGTIGLPVQTGVVGSYIGADITVNDKGIITAINSGTGVAGILLTDLSVGANGAATATGGIAYDDSTGIFTYTPQITFDGDYNSLSNLPTLFDGNYNSLSNLPTLFDGNYNSLSNLPTLFDGNYNSLSNLPTLFSGSYNDLTNQPIIPAAQIQSDWNVTGTLGEILNKPSIVVNINDLGDVDTTGAVNGKILKYNGTNWIVADDAEGTASGGGGTTSVTTSDTAPTSPSDGDLWWKSDTGYLKIYYDDGDSTQWVDTTPAGGGGSSALIGLTDTPAAFGSPGQYLNVNSTADGLEWTSGNTQSIIVPVAYASVKADTAGNGTNISWGAYDSLTGDMVFTFDTALSDADYYVLAERERFDNDSIYIHSKSTIGFTARWLDDDNTSNPYLSPTLHPGVLLVYASDPTLSVAASGGGGGGGATDVNSLTDTDIDSSGLNPLSDGDLLQWNASQSKWINDSYARSISSLTGGYFGLGDSGTGTPMILQLEGLGAGGALELSNGGAPVAISFDYNTGVAGQVITATGDDGSGNATGATWSASTIINAIDDIGDVNIDTNTLANNNILKYDSTANEWKNEPALEGGNLTIGVRSGTALNIGFTGTTFNVVNRAGQNVPITI